MRAFASKITTNLFVKPHVGLHKFWFSQVFFCFPSALLLRLKLGPRSSRIFLFLTFFQLFSTFFWKIFQIFQTHNPAYRSVSRVCSYFVFRAIFSRFSISSTFHPLFSGSSFKSTFSKKKNSTRCMCSALILKRSRCSQERKRYVWLWSCFIV